MPRVTVIIATYNWATVLPYSIGSVLDQTFEDFELLVIGDGCTDESAEVVEAIDDPRVQWHNLPGNTKHQTGPNNEGIRLASGQVIAYLGHDDLWLPHHLEALLEAVDDGASIAASSCLMVAPEGRHAIWPDAFLAGDRKPRSAGPVNWIPPSSLVHDRRLAIEVGGWRVPRDTGMDAPQTDLWKRMIARAGSPRRMPRITCVKIAAAARPGVYRSRPCHEQTYWLQRIRQSDDPEEMLRHAAQEDYVFSTPTKPQRPSGLRGFAYRLRAVLARRGVVSPPPPISADEYLQSVRRYKGLRD